MNINKLVFNVVHGVNKAVCSPNNVYLVINNWNDYSFVTTFHVTVCDDEGNIQEIGNTKIGFKGQTEDMYTYKVLPPTFHKLEAAFFSLGQGVEFYKQVAKLKSSLAKRILRGLNDISSDLSLISKIENEEVYRISLLRSISTTSIKGQFNRVLNGLEELTDFNFYYRRNKSDVLPEIELRFCVEVASRPPTNIHALIGRNGAGKTTILNGIIESILNNNDTNKLFEKPLIPISKDYFSRLVSVSFSAFDPFSPSKEEKSKPLNTSYSYIGLKDISNFESPLSLNALRKDCIEALKICVKTPERKRLLISCISKLNSDDNFRDMGLLKLEQIIEFRNEENVEARGFLDFISSILTRMSSGHFLVFLIIAKLVSSIEEKTLILIDEPESHLHPPLLSAFIRALSDMLTIKNGIAIIATHSPVVLQEVPRTCVWNIMRSGKEAKVTRPEIETFGENVGILTSEIFGLEVAQSGFYDLLSKEVLAGKTYKEITDEYKKQLGFEARAILLSLLRNNKV